MAKVFIEFAKTDAGRQVILISVGYVCCVYQFIFSLLRGNGLRPVVDRFAILTLLLCVSLPIITAFDDSLIARFFNAITGLKILFLLITAVEYSNAWSGSNGYLVSVLKRVLKAVEKRLYKIIN